MIRFLLPLLALVLAAPATPQAAPATAAKPATPPVLVAQVVARYPHDTTAFTEGLIWHDGALYESVGYEGRSDVRRVRLADGRVLARASIPARQFGEGLAAWKDELVSLTWHDGIAHRWNARTLKETGQHRYTGEGWGLASDAAGFVIGDGSPTLRFLDPVTFAERRRIGVHMPDGRALDQVNELESVDGALLANIWQTPWIVRIDPKDGRVTAVVDLRAVVAEVKSANPDAVLNGIAYDATTKRLFVTGKLWPTLFEVKLVPR
jgi:glutamine cyclotransferase